MVAFNFQKQFVPLIESGSKWQTIRQTLRAKEGDRLQLYTGMRTKNCRKIIERDPMCVVARPCILFLGGGVDDFTVKYGDLPTVPVDPIFATYDGFESPAEMLAWFKKNHGNAGYFRDYVYRWRTDL